MQLLLEHAVRVPSYDVDPFGQLRPSALMGYLQEAGRLHSQLLGLTVQGLHELGKTWVMAELRIELRSRPGVDAELSVSTWPSRREEWEVIRDFEVKDAAGEIVARARASYVIIDLTSRRPVRIGDLVPPDYQLARQALQDSPAPIARIVRVEHEIPLPVMMRDLDINLHVNNAVYAQWALEAVPLAMWTTHRLASLEIAFRAETRLGDVVRVAVAIDQVPGGAEVGHRISVEATAVEVARARTRWLSSS